LAITNAISRHLKTIFQEGNQPAHHNHGEHRSSAVFQMAVPGDGHEYIRANQKQHRFHSGSKSYHERTAKLAFHPMAKAM
jgi:hypothetical protein